MTKLISPAMQVDILCVYASLSAKLCLILAFRADNRTIEDVIYKTNLKATLSLMCRITHKEGVDSELNVHLV